MTLFQHVLLWIVVACELVGPGFFLLFLWRRTRSWNWVCVGAILIIPLLAFVIGGGLLALATAYEVFILKPNVSESGARVRKMDDWPYIWLTFFNCGFCGIWVSWLGVLLAMIWFMLRNPAPKS